MSENTQKTKSSLIFQDFTFAQWVTAEAIQKINEHFEASLNNPQMLVAINQHRQRSIEPHSAAHSSWLCELALAVESYVVNFFSLENEFLKQQSTIRSMNPIWLFKKEFVKKSARSKYLDDCQFSSLHAWLMGQLVANDIDFDDDLEWAVACFAERCFNSNNEACAKLVSWCAHAMFDPIGQSVVQGWSSFDLPKKTQHDCLIATVGDDQGLALHYGGPYRERDGFDLTDSRMNTRQALSEANYCVDCHEQAGDFCSSGFPLKKSKPEMGYKVNPQNEKLLGCPLEEKISEMHWLLKRGHFIAALVMITKDNPLCALTGHRICNDCMKSCIYQKQTPVNIPQTETHVLSSVLRLPWGVEIYDLLMRWNPLRIQQHMTLVNKPQAVCVMGMGPAGIALSHHLSMEGYQVVGADGAKIEPVDVELNKKIKYFSEIEQSLSQREAYGFGGVAEYGITVRWDKNFLRLVYILLSRRRNFMVMGGVRFGGTIKVEDVWQLGFSHLALAVGAGLPNALPVPGSMSPGMMQANDFLMALQLNAAHKSNSVMDLQVHLPAVVIGGGLTAVDAATELQAYYVLQVERVYERFTQLLSHGDADKIRAYFEANHPNHLDTFLQHGKAVVAERQRARQKGQDPCFQPMIQEWGGVQIVYRKSMSESPAYRRNHEELMKALEEGVAYIEGCEPIKVVLDDQGFCSGLVCRERIKDEHGEWVFSDHTQKIPATTILVATGAQTNIAYEFEHRGTFARSGFEYKTHCLSSTLEPIDMHGAAEHHKSNDLGYFTSYVNNDDRVSLLGDAHPTYHGNVVRAIASAKNSYALIADAIEKNGAQRTVSLQNLKYNFSTTVASCTYLEDSCATELVVVAPWAVSRHRIGQLYRLQNSIHHPPQIYGQNINMQALIVEPIHIDVKSGEMTFVIEHNSASERLSALFTVGQPIYLMGPTGNRHQSIESGNVYFIGGGEILFQILSYSKELLASNNRLIWVVTQPLENLFWSKKLAESLSQVITIPDNRDLFSAHGFSDLLLSKDVLSQLEKTLRDDHSTNKIRLYVNDRDDVMQACQAMSKQMLQSSKFQWIGRAKTPMQCMLKGVCAQCLVWQKDPITEQRTKAVYACSWQDQPLAIMDVNSVQERRRHQQFMRDLNNYWLQHLTQQPIEH